MKEFDKHIQWLTSNDGLNKNYSRPVLWQGYKVIDINQPPEMKVELLRHVDGSHIIYLLKARFNNYYIHFPFSPTSKLNFKADIIPANDAREVISFEEVDFNKKLLTNELTLNFDLPIQPHYVSSKKLGIEELNKLLKNDGNL